MLSLQRPLFFASWTPLFPDQPGELLQPSCASATQTATQTVMSCSICLVWSQHSWFLVFPCLLFIGVVTIALAIAMSHQDLPQESCWFLAVLVAALVGLLLLDRPVKPQHYGLLFFFFNFGFYFFVPFLTFLKKKKQLFFFFTFLILVLFLNRIE